MYHTYKASKEIYTRIKFFYHTKFFKNNTLNEIHPTKKAIDVLFIDQFTNFFVQNKKHAYKKS